MDFTVDRSVLLEHVSAACGVLAGKTTIPILACVLLDAEDDRVVIAGSDLRLHHRSSFAAKAKKPGAAAVPVKKLQEILKLLPAGEVRLKLLDNHWVELTAEKRKYKLVGMDKKNFPALPVPPEGATTPIPAATLTELVRKTRFAITNEESRYTLRGALLTIGKDFIRMVATDGHRLAFREKPYSGKKETEVLIPHNALLEAARLAESAEEDADVAFACDESNLFFSLDGRMLSGQLLTGQFPNYRAVMPKDNSRRITVDAKELNQAVRRVAQMANAQVRAVKLTLDGDGLLLEANSPEYGEAKESIKAEYSGAALTIGFSAVYLLDFLAVAEGPVEMSFKDEQSAGLFRPAASGEYSYVIMPLRI